MLELKDVHAGYDGSDVLSGLSFQITAGEITCLLGRNGMGKTTALRTIMNLVKLKSGLITFHGDNITKTNTHEIARLGIAYVPQGREIFAGLTVEENLRLGSFRHGNISDAFELFPALKDKRAAAGASLSGGQQQQLAIARALLTRPKLLLLDEPSEGIQPSIVKEIARTVVAASKEKGIAVLLVEQNTDMALKVSDRVLFLEHGTISATHPTHAVTPAVLQTHMGL
jgi:urea ABC transporter ATP-binding protein UrtE